jgi:hypothetical protein
MEPTSINAPHAGDTALTEAEFLQQEAAHAKAATIQAMSELKNRVAAGVDPRGWVEDHPWLTLTGVAAASFVATSIAVPSKEQQALRKLADIEAAIHRQAADSARNGHGKEKAERSLLGMVLVELIGILKPVLGSLVAGMMHDHHADEPPPHQ